MPPPRYCDASSGSPRASAAAFASVHVPDEPAAPASYVPNVYQSPPSLCLCTCVGAKPGGPGSAQPLPVHGAGTGKKSGHSATGNGVAPSDARAQRTKSVDEKILPS